MKRFDAMKSSKLAIIEKTNARISKNHERKLQKNLFYYVGLAVVTCIVSIGLFYLLPKNDAPIEQTAPINQAIKEVIELSVVVDGMLSFKNNSFTFQVDEHTLNIVPILNEYLTVNSVILIDERYDEELKQMFSHLMEENTPIPVTFLLNNLIVGENGTYKVEHLEIVHDKTTDKQQLFLLNFNEEGDITLSEELLKSYSAFKQQYDYEILRGLDPVDVFYLYEYAFAQQDYETVYELIMPEERYYKPEKTEYVAQMSKREDSKFYHLFFGKYVYVTEYEQEGVMNAAIVAEDVNGMQFFGLTQSEDGIWFVNFLPMQ